jgi:hypothetical protein
MAAMTPDQPARIAAAAPGRAVGHRLARARWWLLRAIGLPQTPLLLLALALALLAGGWLLRRERLRMPPPPPPVAAPVLDTTPARQLRDLLVTLPATADLPQRLQQLLALGAQHQVQLQQGQYRLEAEPGSVLARYRMTLPARAEPEALHRFLVAAQDAQPGLAVLSLQIEPVAGERRLSARLGLVLYVRRDAERAR